MRSVFLVAGILFVAGSVRGQQPDPRPTAVPTPSIVVYRVDLVPTGSAFAMNEPKLEGDVWVFYSLPEKTITRVPKARVKQIARWSKDWGKEVVWLVDLDPTGKMLVREEPVLKGKAYVLRPWKEGALLTVMQSDVRKITRLTGFDAFKAEEQERGTVVVTGELPPADAPPR
jgi:hypothetical protein